MIRTIALATLLALAACSTTPPPAKQVYSAPIGPTLTGEPLPAASLNP